MKTIIASISILFLLISCTKTSEKEKEFDALMQEVITIHDDVMPKMGTINELVTKLEAKKDTTTSGQAYGEAQVELKEAHDLMMEWMADFSDKFPHGEEVTSDDMELFESKFKQLQEEKVEVVMMQDQVNTSISNAQALLKN